MSYIIYAELESLIKKRDWCGSNLEKCSPTKIGEQIPWGYLMSPIWVLDNIENEYIIGNIVWKSNVLLWGGTNGINFENKNMLLLTKKS